MSYELFSFSFEEWNIPRRTRKGFGHVVGHVQNEALVVGHEQGGDR